MTTNPASTFLALSEDDQRIAYTQVSIERGVSVGIVEKDFWVSWLLATAFKPPVIGPHLVFKGGTSLSKVFGVINRFSEDIDLSVSPAFANVDMQALDNAQSRTQRDRAMASMQDACVIVVRETILPILESEIQAQLGKREGRQPWLEFELDSHSSSPVIYFNYPVRTHDLPTYIHQQIKLELGSLTEQQPTGQYSVVPWIAEAFPSVFPDWTCNVIALELPRTFWEKATILHAEYHRPAEQDTPERYARHYSDLAALLDQPGADKIMADTVLCERVAAWKSRYFARKWANYGEAKHGTFRLLPHPNRDSELRDDYANMRQMFMTPPPPFDDILDRLREAERTINGK